MCCRITVYNSNNIMAGLKIFVIIVTMLVAKDGAFACSLRSHKHDSSHPCLSSTSDTISDLTPGSTKISPPFDSSPSPSSSSPDVRANGSAVSSTPTLSQNMSSPGSIPFIPPTPSVPSDNTEILNSLIKLLSSPAFSTIQTGKAQTPDASVLPSPSTSNAAQLPASVSKPHTTSLPCAPGSTSSFSSSILPSPPCGAVPIPQLPHSASTQSSGTSHPADLVKFLLKMSSPSYLSTSKPTPLSPPCPLFTPTLSKNVIPGKNPCVLSHPVGPSLNVLPGVSRGSPPSSNRPVPVPASEKYPALTPASVPKHGPETAPEEFPASSNNSSNSMPVSVPVTPLTSVPSSIYGYNPVFINLLLKLLSDQAKTGLSPPLIPTKTNGIPTSNATSVSAPDIKPHTTSTACATSSESSSSSCSSSVLHNQSNGSIFHLKQMLMSMKSPPVSGISFGYNPEFMIQLIKNLLSNQTSSLPPSSSLYPLLQTKLNTTPTPNPIIPTTTFNRPLSELNRNVFNISSNNTFDSDPTGSDTNQNTSISNNKHLADILLMLLTSLNASKTSQLPCLPSSNSHSISTSNTTPISSVPCIPPLSSLPDILSKLSSLTPGSNPSFPGLIPSPSITSLPNLKSFPERVKNLIPIPTPITPTSYPLSPPSDVDLCRSKHKGSLQLLSGSTSTAVNPCLHNTHTPHLPLPCSLSPTKLSSGCKHLLPTV